MNDLKRTQQNKQTARSDPTITRERHVMTHGMRVT
jgi:hypothetical protein